MTNSVLKVMTSTFAAVVVGGVLFSASAEASESLKAQTASFGKKAIGSKLQPSDLFNESTQTSEQKSSDKVERRSLLNKKLPYVKTTA